MKLGILKTGSPPQALAGYATYPAMFRKLLGEDCHDYLEFDAERGDLPADVGLCPAYLITGSASDAYGASPWIVELKRFLNAAKGKAALVGICFGHQVMAEAFGGKVVKSPKGWGIGSHTYEVLRPQPWSGSQASITLPASHQDQVVEAPPGTEVVACSAFSPYGLIAYQDQPATSLQLHPEFEADYAVALTETKRGQGPSDEEIAQAIASAKRPNDREVVAGWINRFLAVAA